MKDFDDASVRSATGLSRPSSTRRQLIPDEVVTIMGEPLPGLLVR
jgi:hypothetical protein